jgi:hypothetical protein
VCGLDREGVRLGITADETEQVRRYSDIVEYNDEEREVEK